MTRKLAVAAGFAAAVVGFGLSTGSAEEKAVSIKQIMKACTGGKGLCAVTVGLAKEEKWDAAATSAGELKKYGDLMVKAPKPKKGTEESWKELTAKFQTQTADVAAAVGKKDAAAVGAAGKAFGSSCKTCHDAHKGK